MPEHHCNSEKEECLAGVSGSCSVIASYRLDTALFSDAKTMFELQVLIPFKNNQ